MKEDYDYDISKKKYVGSQLNENCLYASGACCPEEVGQCEERPREENHGFAERTGLS
jgi:hypothetical protein